MNYASPVRAEEARAQRIAGKRLMLGSASLAMLGAALAQPAFAQASPPPAAPEDAASEAAAPMIATAEQGVSSDSAGPATRDIVVTGSRIVRRDFTATSPIVTVDSALLEKTSSVALEANLNKLPQFAPALTQFDSQNIQSSANVTLGASTVSLRQLGANRNLVLLDGRRGTPINGAGVIDINTIPSAAIQRVEVITGGASSTYGADAVGGVVNFILKNNFQGLEADAQVSLTERGDGFEYRVSAITGANFDDGNGNVLIGMEHFEREAVRRTGRQAYIDQYRSRSVGGTATQGVTENYISMTGNTPSRAAVDAVFGRKGAPAGLVPTTTSIFLNTDDSLFVNTSRAAIAGTQTYAPIVYGYNGDIDGLFRKVTDAGTIGENNLAELASIPQDRWSFFAKAHYDFSDNISFFSQSYFAKTSTVSVSQFAPAVSGWGTLIPHGNAVYTGNAALNTPSSLNADGTTNAAYRSGGRFGLNCGPTGGCTNSQVFPVSPELATLLASRVVPVVAGETAAARASRLANLGCAPTVVPGAAGSGANCTFALNQFLKQLGERRTVNNNLSFQLLAGFNGKVPGTDWTWEIFGSHGETVAKTDQLGFGSVQRWRAVVSSPNYGVGFNATGNQGNPGNGFQGANATCTTGVSPFNQGQDWWADCKAAVQTNTQNENRIAQTQWQGNLQGGLFDLPYGQLRFAAGAEYRRNSIKFTSDSSATQGSSFLEGVIGIFPQGSTRGSTSVTEFYGELLVPVLADLPFAKAVNLELGYRTSDYSSIGRVGTYKINGDWQVTDWLTFRGGYQKASRAPNLGELFTAATQTLDSATEGDPCSTRNPSNPRFVGAYSANPTLNPDAAATRALCTQIMGQVASDFFYNVDNLNNQSNAANASAFLSLIGNPNLKQEDATTYTIGGVIRSPFSSPWLVRLRASVDYYNVKLTNAISQQGQDGIYRRCFSKAFNPTLTYNDFCALVQRNPANGIPATTSVTFSNGGAVTTAGVDAQIDWGLNFKDAGIALPGSFSLNFLVNYLDTFKTTTDAGIIPAVDFAGTLGGGQVGTNAGAYRWKSFTTLTYALQPATISLQWRHLPKTKASIAANIPTTTFVGAPNYDVFDLSGTLAVTRGIVFRFGVDNLFDKRPPVVTYDPQAVLPTLAGGNISPGYYDILGRRFYLGAKAKF
jgi:outer membrane receptor protein involved in Fe transport